MTYGLAFASPAFAGVVTDRRLTGARWTEDCDKCGLVAYTDGRLAYTLTGFAEQGVFKTRIWVAEALCEAGRGGRSVNAALEEFANTATADVARMRFQKPEDGRLTVALTGFVSGPLGTTTAVLRLVSNFEKFGHESSLIPWRKFEVSSFDFDLSPSHGYPICIMSIGDVLPSPRRLEPMTRALASSVPPTIAVDAAVEIIRAKSTPTGPIGTWCSSVVLPRLGNQSALFDYLPGEPRQDYKLPTFIYAKFDNAGAFVLTESRMRRIDRSGRAVMRVPNVKRHHPCPCGSKRRFKDCHGHKQGAQKIGNISGRVNIKFKMLPNEDVNLLKIASRAIVLGSGESNAIVTFGVSPFRIRRRLRKAGSTTVNADTDMPGEDHRSEG